MPEMKPTSAPTEPTPQNPGAEPEIHTIPEKFYGAALKAHIKEAETKPEASNGVVPPPKRSMVLPIVLIVLVLLLGSGGAFVYFNQALLFPQPAPAPTPTPTPTPPAPQTAEPPVAPTGLTATSTNPQSVNLGWTDNASNESGYRIERAAAGGTAFSALSALPPNSTTFIDSAIQSGTAYEYRVFAVNQGGDSPSSNVASATVPLPPPPPPETPRLPPAGLDTDSDGLTDLEEALFGTNPQNPDTDADGFLDGNEVFHLYNPNGRAPGTLLEAKLVAVVNSPAGWSMQVPSSWKVTQGNAGSATYDTGHGETFHVTIEEDPTRQAVLEWYLASHPDTPKSQILKFVTKKGYEGIEIISDGSLTVYLPWEDKVFTMVYDMDGQTFINYRTTYSMMLNSLVLTGVPQVNVTASSTPLPFEPGATSTGVVAQPESVFPSGSTTTGSATGTTP